MCYWVRHELVWNELVLKYLYTIEVLLVVMNLLVNNFIPLNLSLNGGSTPLHSLSFHSINFIQRLFVSLVRNN